MSDTTDRAKRGDADLDRVPDSTETVMTVGALRKIIEAARREGYERGRRDGVDECDKYWRAAMTSVLESIDRDEAGEDVGAAQRSKPNAS